ASAYRRTLSATMAAIVAHRRGAVVAPSAAAGLLLAASLPPWGWSPLAPLGFAVMAWRLGGRGLGRRGRMGAGAGRGAGLAVAGCGLAALRRRPVAAAAAWLGVAAVVVVAAAAPDGGTGPALRVAAVQGGGVRDLRAVDRDKAGVFRAHLAAGRRVQPPVDL